VKVVMNWSSGKDAALAYHLLRQDSGISIECLLTTVSEEHDRVFMHGVREQLLDLQAERMGQPLIKIKLPASPDDSLYDRAMRQTLQGFKDDGITAAAFGDIFLDDLRLYREQQLGRAGISAVFPLWKKDTRALVQMVEQAGIEAVIVCVNETYLGKEFLGKKVNADFLSALPPGVDPCGENGEFHTFVSNAPFFSAPIQILAGEIVHKTYDTGDGKKWDTGFYFLDLQASL